MQMQSSTLQPPSPYVPATTYATPAKEPASSSFERQRKHRAEILALARCLLAEEGYEGFTIRRMAEYSSVTAQTLHNNFGTRIELIASALNEFTNVAYRFALSISSDPFLFLIKGATYYHACVTTPKYMRQSVACWAVGKPFRDLMQRYAASIRTPVLRKMYQRSMFRKNIDPNAFGAQVAFINSTAFYDWVLGYVDLDGLRQQIIAGNKLVLYGALTPVAARDIEAWISDIEHSLMVFPQSDGITNGISVEAYYGESHRTKPD
jgi:AcrR family transcriptional regulator